MAAIKSKRIGCCDACEENYCMECSDAEESAKFCSKTCEQDPEMDDREDDYQMRREFEREEVRAMNRDLRARRGEL